MIVIGRGRPPWRPLKRDEVCYSAGFIPLSLNEHGCDYLWCRLLRKIAFIKWYATQVKDSDIFILGTLVLMMRFLVFDICANRTDP